MISHREQIWLERCYADYMASTKPFIESLMLCEQYRAYILTIDANGKHSIEPCSTLPPEVQKLHDSATEGLRSLRESFERRVK